MNSLCTVRAQQSLSELAFALGTWKHLIKAPKELTQSSLTELQEKLTDIQADVDRLHRIVFILAVCRLFHDDLSTKIVASSFREIGELRVKSADLLASLRIKLTETSRKTFWGSLKSFRVSFTD